MTSIEYQDMCERIDADFEITELDDYPEAYQSIIKEILTE